MKSDKSRPRAGVGSSSMLMILVALAMTALGLLALGSARQTEAHTARNLQASLGYAQAAARVQQRLADIDEAAAEYAELMLVAADAIEWFEARAIEGVEWSLEGEGVSFVITEEAGDGRAIVATGKLLSGGKARYRLTSHAMTVQQNEPERSILLMGE